MDFYFILKKIESLYFSVVFFFFHSGSDRGGDFEHTQTPGDGDSNTLSVSEPHPVFAVNWVKIKGEITRAFIHTYMYVCAHALLDNKVEQFLNHLA